MKVSHPLKLMLHLRRSATRTPITTTFAPSAVSSASQEQRPTTVSEHII
jgi:hypothetical protein